MSVIRPFRGVRPAKELVAEVASYPYDVINSEEARELVQGNPNSFLHIVKSEVDLPENIELYSQPVYQKASENLKNFLQRGTLIQEEKDCYYIYRQIMGDHVQTGVLACSAVEEYEKDLIKKHELTRADKEQDRINHVDICNANTGPVFLTYKAMKSIDVIVSEITSRIPEYDFTATDGIKHILWVVREQNLIEKLSEEFKKVPHMYIADGHHRSASAFKVGKLRKENNPNHDGNEEYNGFLSVIFPDNQLKILSYNRVVKDLNGLSEEEFMSEIEKSFTVEVTSQKEPSKTKEICMYLSGKWYLLKPKEGLYDPNNPVDVLDISILQNHLLNPVLGVQDPRTDNRIWFIGGIRGTGELEKKVDAGVYKVAFSMYPVLIQELMDIADQGMIMPPKSTWFEPKLRSGMVTHLLT